MHRLGRVERAALIGRDEYGAIRSLLDLLDIELCATEQLVWSLVMEETTGESKTNQELREVLVVCVVLQRHDVEFLVAVGLLLACCL